MPRSDDPFANFERMRREIDELFGDIWSRAGLTQRKVGFSPRVDVYYCPDPPEVVIKADLAGIDIDDVNLEVRGRTLVISGERGAHEGEGRVYQQIEIESGPFVREIQLGAEVDAQRAKATYEDGILRVRLPITEGTEVTQVPISQARKRIEGRGE
jgi:HSP20 family protein